MAVRIRLKRMGRSHRPFYRVCAMDSRAPRDGRVIEELGYYDPMLKETDARAVLKRERIDHWLSVGAQPTEKVGVLIKKYGSNGTHLEQQTAALERIQANKPTAPPPEKLPPLKAEEDEAAAPADGEAAAEGEAAEAPADDAAAATEAEASTDAAAEEKPAEGGE